MRTILQHSMTFAEGSIEVVLSRIASYVFVCLSALLFQGDGDDDTTHEVSNLEVSFWAERMGIMT